MTRTKLMASVATLSLITTPAFAQDSIDLGQILVSGGISPVEAEALGRSVTVVTGEELEERGIATVQDALRAVPGVAVGGTGTSLQQVRIRGAEANHTLVLIDGVEAIGGDSQYNFSGLQTANIDRIEVLRGPQSVAYGSNASAGVINIVTRTADAPGVTYGASLEAGDATSASAFAGWRGTQGGVSLGLSYLDDEGYDVSGDGGEKDGTERRSITMSGDFAVTPDLTLGFTVSAADEEYDFDAASFTATNADEYVVDAEDLVAETQEVTGAIYADFAMMGGQLTHRVTLESTRNELSVNDGPVTEVRTDAAKYRLSYALDGQPVEQSDRVVSALIEWEEDSSTSNPDFERASTSYAVEYRGRYVNGFDVQAGIRRDDNEVFEDQTTWNVALSYTLPDSGMRLHTSAGVGVVNPTYFELYAAEFGYTGNPNLKPETNRSFDIGVEIPVADGRGTVDVTLFREILTDEITDVATGPFEFSFENQEGESTRQGIELAADVQVTDMLSVRAAYTYLAAYDPDGSVEIRRPRQELNLGATVDVMDGRGSVSADLRHVAGAYDTQFWGTFETVRLPAYTTLDLAGRYEVMNGVDLTARVTNALDAETSDVWGYANRGRAVYVGLNASF